MEIAPIFVHDAMRYRLGKLKGTCELAHNYFGLAKNFDSDVL